MCNYWHDLTLAQTERMKITGCIMYGWDTFSLLAILKKHLHKEKNEAIIMVRVTYPILMKKF